jgi:hypothetical protein
VAGATPTASLGVVVEPPPWPMGDHPQKPKANSFFFFFFFGLLGVAGPPPWPWGWLEPPPISSSFFFLKKKNYFILIIYIFLLKKIIIILKLKTTPFWAERRRFGLTQNGVVWSESSFGRSRLQGFKVKENER